MLLYNVNWTRGMAKIGFWWLIQCFANRDGEGSVIGTGEKSWGRWEATCEVFWYENMAAKEKEVMILGKGMSWTSSGRVHSLPHCNLRLEIEIRRRQSGLRVSWEVGTTQRTKFMYKLRRKGRGGRRSIEPFMCLSYELWKGVPYVPGVS